MKSQHQRPRQSWDFIPACDPHLQKDIFCHNQPGTLMEADPTATEELAHAFTPTQKDGRLLAFTFQLLLLFTLFSLPYIRERHACWMSGPGITLMASLAAGALVGIPVDCFGLGRWQAPPRRQSMLMAGCVRPLVLGLNDAIKTRLIRRALQKMHPQPTEVT